MQNTVRAQFNLTKETFATVEEALLWIKKMTRTSGEVAIASWYQIGNGKVVMA